MTQKNELRQAFLENRKSISQERRREASSQLADHFQNKGNILSFCSLGSEIDLTPLNRLIAAKNRLYLPRVEQNFLTIYQVTDIEKQLICSALGVFEPNPLFCCKAKLTEIDCILVPGLAFDLMNYRIGYGKGYYDRMLAQAKKSLSIGVGFKEQMYVHPLPKDPWDLPVAELALF